MKLALFLTAVSAVAGHEATETDEYWRGLLETVDSFPTVAPTPPPTAECQVEVSVDCAWMNPETDEAIACAEIPPLETKECMCPECVREMAFVYTGDSCSGNEVTCTDLIPWQGGVLKVASVSFFACNSTTPAFTTAPINPGTQIDLTLGGEVCLPDCMDITVTNLAGEVVQQFQFDTECAGGNDLVLKESYGALVFNGYTCDENDVNNCLLDVIFGVEACNQGTANMTLYEFTMDFNGTLTDFLTDESPPIVASGECYEAVGEGFFDRCLEGDYVTTVFANATSPNGGPICEDSAEISISFDTIPTPTPTPAPTGPLTPPPTGECNVNVTVAPECPLIPCNFDRCLQRPFRMLFRVDPAPCSASTLKRCPGVDPDTCTCIRNVTLSDDQWNEQKFFCTDFNGGPQPTFNGSFWATSTPEKDTTVFYFNGPIDIPANRRFNATAPNAPDQNVEANMFLNLYTADPAKGGQLLQQVLFHSSCSQQLYLLDIFGSFQLLEFENVDQGVIGFGINPVVSFKINLDAVSDNSGDIELDFLSIVVLSNTAGLLPPQVLPQDVEGLTIPPPYETTEEVELIPGQPMNVITTIGGTTVDGVGCFDVSNTTIQCDATVDPSTGEDTATRKRNF